MDYKRFLRGPGVYLLLLLGVILLTRLFSLGAVDSTKKEIDYRSVLRLIEEDKVDHIAIGYETLVGMYKTGQTVSIEQFPSKYDFFSVPPRDDKQFYADVNAIYAHKLNKSVQEISPADYNFKLSNLPTPVTPWWLEMVPFLIAIVLIGVLWMVLMRQQQGGNSKVMSFGKSRARMNDSEKNKKTFADIKGAEEEKEELREIVEFLKNPRRFTEVGARIPKGVLLVGPPGTGKTLFAKAVAGEAGVPFFSISGSDFVEMFVGVGASRVRDLFDQAKRNLPSIVFIDEIDAVGRHRGAGLGGGHDEREQTLNQLLVEMDGFAPNEGVIIFAATNRPDILDPALLRPGRFDRQVTVHYPDIKGRKEILELYAHGKPLGKDVDLEVLAKRTPFSSPADLENIMNEAALLTARAGKLEIGVEQLEEAVTRVQMGPEKKSRVVTDKDRKLVAYHEAGHALVAHEMPNCDPVHEICIIPRGRAAGYTTMLPSEEYSNVSRSRLLDIVAELLGGHAAEKLVLEDVSTGSTSDLQRATEIVRNMITQYGMSEELGPVYLGGEQEVFIGRDFTSSRNYSEHVAMMIDRETRTLLESAYSLAEKTLKKNVVKLHAIAKRLLEKEKVDRSEFEDIMNNEQPELLTEGAEIE